LDEDKYPKYLAQDLCRSINTKYLAHDLPQNKSSRTMFQDLVSKKTKVRKVAYRKGKEVHVTGSKKPLKFTCSKRRRRRN